MAHAHLPASMALTLAGEIAGPDRAPGDGAPPAAAAVRRRSGRWAAQELADADRGGPRRTSREPFAGAAVLLERHGAVAVGPRPRPGGRPARARRGAVPDLARCAADSRRAALDSVPGGRRHAQPSRSNEGGMMNARAYLAELLGTFLFLTIGYASVPAFAAASAPARRTCWSCRSRSASACWPRSSRSATSPAATSIRR